MIHQIELKEFLSKSKNTCVIDVRTPDEFSQGHIIGAYNLPLFSNEERKLVGTCYKQEGREPAILLGFELIGNRWATYIREAEKLCTEKTPATPKHIVVHCWRGGMRSAAMAWALSMYGFNVSVLQGGYKVCRKYYLDILEQRYPILILSGKTGSAKTKILLEMQKLGEQVIDLEGLANHQGSSFGSMGSDYQPSQELFENLLANELMKQDVGKNIWLENESLAIGKIMIPRTLFAQMRSADIINIELPYTERVDFLYEEYGKLDKVFLMESVHRISKRLGPNETKLSLQAIEENRMKDFIKQVLVYYDKNYQKGKESRVPETIHPIELNQIHPHDNAIEIIKLKNKIKL
ncbi:MAG: tRNA 2-selenouridine(34) synthase MnmH [Bacteroidetes bacterium]|nr:tRNA 2-selenouridine(34) synthase MnmH [Bacteroidota bacterium]